MDILALVAAFGGGIIGAYMGALPAFIMTGVFAIIGAIATAAGAPADIAIGTLAFGSFVGPHIAFAGGVAAAAYAGKKGKLSNGADILSALNGLGSPDVLIVGGVFGVIGYVIATLIGMLPVIGAGGFAGTDLPGITVFISALIVRFVFGKSGLTGKHQGSHKLFSTGANFVNNVVIGLGLGIVVSFIAAGLKDNAVALGIFPIIMFGFSAVTLIFTQTGFAVPATHHITLPAALAASVGLNAFGVPGAILGVVFGVLGAVLGDFFACTFNSGVDTHIDPPAGTIFTLTIVINLIGSLLK